MDISPVTQTQTQTTSSSTSSSSAVLSADFELFLQMLTAQAEYQDPLDPIDNAEYAAQLAQFSMVEQQVTTNDLLEQVISGLGVSDMSSAANWIGMEALTSGPANFQGDPITVSPNPAIAADAVNLVVYTPSGTEVQRIALPVTAEPYVWNGRDATGSVLPFGEYDLRVESISEGEVIVEDPALTYTRVNEARIDNGTTILLLQNGYAIEAANVIGLRAPDSA